MSDNKIRELRKYCPFCGNDKKKKIFIKKKKKQQNYLVSTCSFCNHDKSIPINLEIKKKRIEKNQTKMNKFEPNPKIKKHIKKLLEVKHLIRSNLHAL